MSIYNLRKQLLAIFTQTCQLSCERYTGMVERLSDYHAGTNKHCGLTVLAKGGLASGYTCLYNNDAD